MVVLCYLLADLLMAEVQSLKCTNLYAAQELCRKVLSKKCLNATEVWSCTDYGVDFTDNYYCA